MAAYKWPGFASQERKIRTWKIRAEQSSIFSRDISDDGDLDGDLGS
jgi:hypothetical protein